MVIPRSYAMMISWSYCESQQAQCIISTRLQFLSLSRGGLFLAEIGCIYQDMSKRYFDPAPELYRPLVTNFVPLLM